MAQKREKIKWRLGLDIGTNSIGWSVLGLGEDDEVKEIVNAGARIFSDGRVDDNKTTLAAVRRGHRGERRRRDRYLQRKKKLINLLTQAGLFPQEETKSNPQDETERERLQKKNPLELRARALTEKLEAFEVGRALFHINQRRGFKSNRKDLAGKASAGEISEKESEEDAVNVAVEELNSDNYPSWGDFLWQRHKERKPTRVRSQGDADNDLPRPTRKLYEDEFEKIWKTQASYHSQMRDEMLKKKVYDAIFSQRPLKPQIVGKCTYMQDEDRAFHAMPSFQRYRIYQDVNHLTLRDGDKVRRLRDDSNMNLRNAIVKLLEEYSGDDPNEVTLKTVKTHLIENGLTNSRDVAFENASGKEKLVANLTSHMMRQEEYVGEQWDTWDPIQQDEFMRTILSDPEKKEGSQENYASIAEQEEEKCRKLQGMPFRLSELAAKKCIHANPADGAAKISEKAAKLMLEKMQHGIKDSNGERFFPSQVEAALAVAQEREDFIDPNSKSKQTEEEFERDRLPQLPYYGKLFREIPGDPKANKSDIQRRYGFVTNTTVHIALNQIRAVVNELIACYGHPHSIAIELGRELPKGASERNNIISEQGEGEKRNTKLNKELAKHGVKKNRANRLLLRLWKEQKHRCFYSGKCIGLADLFGEDAKAEVDHILPYSKSLDDTTANKVVCTREANQYKDNMTPWQAFHDYKGDKYDWEDIICRARDKAKVNPKLSFAQKEEEYKRRTWRFHEDPLQEDKQGDDFLERHLNDNRYIGRLAKKYLEHICYTHRIDVVTGQHTADLRWKWGLDSILHDATVDKAKDGNKGKNRNDHRHHAIDAIVIGRTTKRLLHKMRKKAEEREPWPTFCEKFHGEVEKKIKDIYVSHRVAHKNGGPLHKEIAYGIVDKKKRDDFKGNAKKVKVVSRVSIAAFKEHIKGIGGKEDSPDKPKKQVEYIEKKIGDEVLRGKILAYFKEKGLEGLDDLARKENIRHLRVSANKTVQPIRDKRTKQVYKAYALGNNWAAEIYEMPSTGKWKTFVISQFEATRGKYQPKKYNKKPEGAKPVMQLFGDDVLQITEGGKKRLMRVHKMSQGNVYICEHNEANVDKRLKFLVDNERCYPCSASRLQKFGAKKADISPTGQVRIHPNTPKFDDE